jgi:hypothetical protein
MVRVPNVYLVPNIGYCLSKCDYDKERDRNNLFLNIKKNEVAMLIIYLY